MPDHDDEAPADETSERRELERIAFARPETSADAEAADEALRELVAQDEVAAAAAAAAAALVSTVPPEPEQAKDETSDPHDDELAAVSGAATPTATRRRRSLVPLLVLAGLAVGVGVGVLFAHAGSVAASPEPNPSTGVVTDFGFTPIGPQFASASSALAELRSKQTAADVFPLPSFTTTLDIEPKSIHRILTTGDGLTLWTGRTSEDICLLFTGTDATSRLDAGSNCATPSEFGTDGLTLSDGRDQWSWNGVAFTTTIGN